MSTGQAWQIALVNRYAWPDESATAQILGDLTAALHAVRLSPLTIASDQRYDDPAARLGTAESTRAGRVRRVRGTRFGRARALGRILDYRTFAKRAQGALRRERNTRLVVTMSDPPLLGTQLHRTIRALGALHVEWLQDLYPEVAIAGGVLRADSWLTRWLLARRQRSLRDTDAIVVVGERMREHIVACGAPPERVHVIPNWADTDAIVPLPPEHNALRKDWGLDGRFVVGYSGNFGRVHAFDGLLDAAQRLRDRADIAFVLVGAGAQAERLRERVDALGLSNIRFRPFQPRERLGESLCVPDLHVVSLAPTFEGLVVPSKLYGAVAAGRPVLFLGDTDGEVARFLRRHDCGVTVDAADGAAIATTIAALADDAGRCRTLGERARAAAEKEGSRRVAIGRWLDLLASLGVTVDHGDRAERGLPAGEEMA